MGLFRHQLLAHLVALEPIGLLQAGAAGQRSQLLAAPILPASSPGSTASIYSGRSPADIRGSSVSGGMQLFAPACNATRSWRLPVLRGS